MRTPLTLVTGSLGSGKTTLLRHILTHPDRKIAIVMNEFGEIGIDSKIIKGKNVQIAELDGGCVCCSLIGEFEAAVDEIIQTVNPDIIIVEATGVAEPDALIFDIQESLPQVRLDGVIALVDADGMVKFPAIGRTMRMQIQDADLILLNKTDLTNASQIEDITKTIRAINPHSPIITASYSQVDPDLLFGLGRNKQLKEPKRRHQIEYQTVNFTTSRNLDPEAFSRFVDTIPPSIIRAKGFIRLPKGSFLFNYVTGRWDLEPFEGEETTLVFIGKEMDKEKIICQLKACEV